MMELLKRVRYPGSNLYNLRNNLVSIQILRPWRFKIKIEGHPDECIAGAHRLFGAWFKGPWHMTSIEALSPMQRKKQRDNQWLFTIEAQFKNHPRL